MGGTVAVTFAVVAGPGPGLSGYVSEAGIVGSPYALAYRIGVLVLAAALLLLAAALPPALRPAAALLAAGGLATMLSGAVTCSDGCPLPPFERATVADLVHGGASIAAVAAVAFAMLMMLRTPAAGRTLSGLATVAALVTFPLAAAVGLAMLTVGRGALVSTLERLLLAVTIGWGFTTAVLIGCSRLRL
ncbi:DUF998 domain-containing protein [Micromonospora sp. CPCC 206060]|uniref:DUF998 domain-containing protein n=1 Tax=Micromonospora sp. CPCC 206060 TaxID=3122406 RepID=UPI003FA5D853